jgi:hypothetical protein
LIAGTAPGDEAADNRNSARFAAHRDRVKMGRPPVSTAPDREKAMRVLFATLTMLIGLLAFPAAKADSPPPPPDPKMVCTQQYQPVCGTKNGKRVTYPNHCVADVDKAADIGDGACAPGDDSPIKH